MASIIFILHGKTFYAIGFVLYPLKTSGTSGFLLFSEGIERDHWHGMDQRLTSEFNRSVGSR